MNEGDLKKGRLGEVQEGKKKAFLVGIYFSAREKPFCENNLQELKSLVSTFGLETKQTFEVALHHIESSFFIGKGKVEEIFLEVQKGDVDLVIFDDEIAPHQQRNLEEALKLPVIDRTELILGVFAQRAKTKEAKIQIELAQYRYQFPRLKRLWTHLSRQKTGGGGSGGFLKGEGERQIEIDRRILRRKMHCLQDELKEVIEQRKLQRKARERRNVPTFAIIGYTNVGKSTLLNTLTSANVLVEDKLFATLDPTVRKFSLQNHQEILLIDTVGFIRKIPHTLIAAFKSTLEEAVFADILVHLIDVSHPQAEEQAIATYEVLKELGALDHPIITCLNKVDACEDKEMLYRLKIKYPKVVEISALHKIGLDSLVQLMQEEVKHLRKVVSLKIPQSEYSFVSKLLREGHILSQEYEENDIFLRVEIPVFLEKELSPFLLKKDV